MFLTPEELDAQLEDLSRQLGVDATLSDVEDDEHGDHRFESEDFDDGQPTEYEEWQDVYGGDDWDHGQYDEQENSYAKDAW